MSDVEMTSNIHWWDGSMDKGDCCQARWLEFDGTHMVEGENWLPQAVIWLPLTNTHTHKHASTQNN